MKDLGSKRISKDIGVEIKGLKKLLTVIEKEPKRYDRFVADPIKDLEEFGIDISKYCSEHISVDVLKGEIVKIMQQAVQRGVMERIESLIEMVAKTDYSRSTESSYEYNFDHSSHSDYKYESHTGTERGTFSETSSGQATNTDTRFNGINLTMIEEMMHGPLISEGVMKEIVMNVERTLGQASQGMIRR